MMKLTLGSAPDSWGVWFADDPKQIPWPRFLDEIAACGYEWTELGPYGYLPTDEKILREELTKRHLKICAGVVMAHLEDPAAWPGIERQIDETCDYIARFGARYLVIIDDIYSNLFTGEIFIDPVLKDDQWKRLIETTHRIALMAKEKFGLTSAYHPHADTHVQHPDQVERFICESDPALVGICLDTGHQAYRGEDVIEFMRRHFKRIPYMHLKSIDAEMRERVYREQIPFAKAVEQDMFVEPARGAVDFVKFVEVLREVNYEGFGVVEQDMYPCAFDKPFPIARRTHEYLKSLGMGEQK
ncbi:MAG: TIM barrel protein [Verrucomicrobiae bacterium]|nr:TIM barrel protein [Verrucomicrobiae bacterium]